MGKEKGKKSFALFFIFILAAWFALSAITYFISPTIGFGKTTAIKSFWKLFQAMSTGAVALFILMLLQDYVLRPMHKRTANLRRTIWDILIALSGIVGSILALAFLLCVVFGPMVAAFIHLGFLVGVIASVDWGMIVYLSIRALVVGSDAVFSQCAEDC